MMEIDNTDTYRSCKRLAEHDLDYEQPEIPEMSDLAVSGPSFVVIEGKKDGAAMDTLSQVHDLYRKEKASLQQRHAAKQEAAATHFHLDEAET